MALIKQVGIIGLGKMGQPMGRHLMARGFDVNGCDIDQDRNRVMAALGVTICESPRAVAAASDLVIVVVGFDDEVLDVVAGQDGLLAGAAEGKVIAIASTVSIETMQQLEKLAGAFGVHVLDTPLCRGEPAAEQGELLLLAGGREDIFERCRPAFESFSSDSHLLGSLGAGQAGKMINNLLLWVCISGNYEGLKLGAALGLDAEKLRNALLKSSGNNWALETWLQPRPMPWAEKDMAIIMEEADKARLSLPLCGVTREVIKALKVERGLANPRLKER